MSLKISGRAVALTLVLSAIACENHNRRDATSETGNASGGLSSADIGSGGAVGLGGAPGTGGIPGGNATTGGSVGAAANDSATSGLATQTAQLDDGQIAEVLITANTGEVAAGKLALGHANTAPVKSFAQMMIDDHTKATTQIRDLAKKKNLSLVTNAVSTKLKEHGDTELKQLTGTKDGFDAAYVQAQVEDHRTVLALLNAALPAADDSDFKALLQTLRTAVSMHLDHALDISGPSRNQPALAK